MQVIHMITQQPLSIIRLSRAALVLLFAAWAPAGVAAVTATLTQACTCVRVRTSFIPRE